MKRNSWHFILLIGLLALLDFSCATAPEKVVPEKPVQVKKQVEGKETYVPKEEESKSLELFTEVLDLVESTDDRKSILPKIEDLYDKIISQYPDAPLAIESYWKLITIYVDDYSPPAYDKAESKYQEFLRNYPQSFLKGFIEDTLGNSYYRNAEWNRLLKLSSPSYQEYLEKGSEPRASVLFMYSEANYHLGNIIEAEKGYKIVTKLFPKLIVGIKSKKMLEKIKENRGKQ